MIGKQQIVLDASDWIKGVSSGANIADGGFSGETQAVNLKYDVGVINGVPAMVDSSGSLAGNPIAYTANGFVSSSVGKNGFIIGTDGKVGAISTTQTLSFSAALTGTYTGGVTDIAQFLTKIFITSQGDIAMMDTDLTNGDPDWGSTVPTVTLALDSTAGVPHPLLNFIGRLYVGDAYKIHYITNTTTATSTALSLNQQNTIRALGIDSSTGRMLIATYQGLFNNDGSMVTENRIFVWDGQSTVVEREVVVDGMISGFKTVGGTTFVIFKDKVGYWNGSGVSYLRKLKNVNLTSTEAPSKHFLASIDNNLFVVDGNQILAYGEVLPGRKVWYPALYNTVSGNANFTLVCPVGDNKIGVGFATNKFYTFDTLGTGAGDLNTFKTNRISFPRPVFIRSVNLEYGGSGVANGYSGGSLYYRTQAAAGSSTLMSPFPNNTGATQWEAEGIVGISEKVKWVQFIYAAGTAPGLRRMIIYYDVAE